jgi:hypothetical protein
LAGDIEVFLIRWTASTGLLPLVCVEKQPLRRGPSTRQYTGDKSASVDKSLKHRLDLESDLIDHLAAIGTPALLHVKGPLRASSWKVTFLGPSFGLLGPLLIGASPTQSVGSGWWWVVALVVGCDVRCHMRGPSKDTLSYTYYTDPT